MYSADERGGYSLDLSPTNREYDHEKENDDSYNKSDKSTSFGSEAGSMPRVIFERV
jgi:hypothetical protein